MPKVAVYALAIALFTAALPSAAEEAYSTKEGVRVDTTHSGRKGLRVGYTFENTLQFTIDQAAIHCTGYDFYGAVRAEAEAPLVTAFRSGQSEQGELILEANGIRRDTLSCNLLVRTWIVGGRPVKAIESVALPEEVTAAPEPSGAPEGSDVIPSGNCAYDPVSGVLVWSSSKKCSADRSTPPQNVWLAPPSGSCGYDRDSKKLAWSIKGRSCAPTWKHSMKAEMMLVSPYGSWTAPGGHCAYDRKSKTLTWKRPGMSCNDTWRGPMN